MRLHFLYQLLYERGAGFLLTKLGLFLIFDMRQLIQFPGFKLFYRLDKPLMSPSDVLNLDRAPLMVMYQ